MQIGMASHSNETVEMQPVGEHRSSDSDTHGTPAAHENGGEPYETESPTYTKNVSITDQDLNDQGDEATVEIPWAHRGEPSSRIESCGFITKPAFWFRVQWAVQFTLFACLPSALLIFLAEDSFVAASMFLPFCVVTTKATLGEAVNNMIDVFKGFIIVLAVLLPLAAAGVRYHWAMWGACYAVFVLLVAFFTQGGVTKNTLLLFTIAMVVHYTNSEPQLEWKFAAYLVRDSLVGCGFGFLSSVFPYPRTNYRRVADSYKLAVAAIGTAVDGAAESFFCPSSVERGSNIIKIKFKRDQVKEHLDRMEREMVNAWYEPFVGQRLTTFQARHKLMTKMARSIDSMIDVLEFVQYNPALTKGTCTKTNAFQEKFGESFQQLALSIHHTLQHLASGPQRRSLKHKIKAAKIAFLGSFLDALNYSSLSSGDANGECETKCRKDVDESRLMNEDFPRIEIAYFAFNLSQLAQYLQKFEEPEPWTCGARMKAVFLSPCNVALRLKSQLADLRAGVSGERERLIDACKMSVAMTSTIALLLVLDSPEPVFSGAAVIAFVSGNDAGQTMRTSGEQLFGTVFGNVFGFLLASISSASLSLGICICVVGLVTGFFRSSDRYGWVAFYAQFAAFGAIRPNLDASVALTGIQQNVGAIVWYFILNFFVLPTRPSERLFREMRAGFIAVKSSIGVMRHVVLQSVADSEQLGHSKPSDEADRQRADDLPGLCAAQLASLGGADTEPTLSDRPFPTEIVRQVIQRQMELHSILTVMGNARAVLRRSPTARTNWVLTAIAPHVAHIVQRGMRLMDFLIVALDKKLVDGDQLLVTACKELDDVTLQMKLVERISTVELLSKLRSGELQPDRDPAVPPAVLTTVHCLTALNYVLDRLFKSFSSMQHALDAM